jgi:hypothetical protein
VKGEWRVKKRTHAKRPKSDSSSVLFSSSYIAIRNCRHLCLGKRWIKKEKDEMIIASGTRASFVFYISKKGVTKLTKLITINIKNEDEGE